jgi:hypothetical protein
MLAASEIRAHVRDQFVTKGLFYWFHRIHFNGAKKVFGGSFRNSNARNFRKNVISQPRTIGMVLAVLSIGILVKGNGKQNGPKEKCGAH